MIELTKITEEINNRKGRRRRKKHGGNAREVKNLRWKLQKRQRLPKKTKNYREHGCDRAERTDKEYVNYR